MTAAEVRMTGDRAALELVPRDEHLEGLERRLHAAPSRIPSRRIGHRLTLDLASGVALMDQWQGEFSWSSGAARAVANVRRIREAAPEVLAQARELQEGGVPAARAALPEAATLFDRLDDHQVENVAVMTIPRGWGACIFDEQGTGKTVTTIAAFDVLVDRNEVDVLVVVAPKSMVAEWATEFRRFTKNLYGVTVLQGSRRERAQALASGADVIVVNYEGAITMLDDLKLLARRSRVVLAVDESYNVKNPEALRTGAVSELREWCSRCFVLCGTPAPNAPEDLVAQFDLVDFGLTFGGVVLDDDTVVQRSQIRQAMEERGVYTRNLKEAVLPDLPTRDFAEIELELAPMQRKLYAFALDELVADARSATDAEYERNLASFLRRRHALLRICSNPAPVAPGYDEVPAKLRALDEILAERIAAGEKIVLWSFYRASLDALDERYRHFGLVRIDGGVSDVAARRTAIRSFQEDEATRIFLGNPAAAGSGLTLHRARVAIYESMSNQAAHFMQSLDRIHRRGQDRDVEYVVLLCRDTIEQDEYPRLLDKINSQADVLGDPAPKHPTRQVFLAELLCAQERLR